MKALVLILLSLLACTTTQAQVGHEKADSSWNISQNGKLIGVLPTKKNKVFYKNNLWIDGTNGSQYKRSVVWLARHFPKNAVSSSPKEKMVKAKGMFKTYFPAKVFGGADAHITFYLTVKSRDNEVVITFSDFETSQKTSSKIINKPLESWATGKSDVKNYYKSINSEVETLMMDLIAFLESSPDTK